MEEQVLGSTPRTTIKIKNREYRYLFNMLFSFPLVINREDCCIR
jgi:hypothetical protein